MRSAFVVMLVFVCAEASAQRSRSGDLRMSGGMAARQLDMAMANLSGADESLGAMQQLLERDAGVLAKLREARTILEEETQPMTVVSAVLVRVRQAEQLDPHRDVQRELDPVTSLLMQYRQSSANIDLPLLTKHVDDAVNAASDVVVDDVRMIQPALAQITRMQEALQTRLTALVQSQGRAMEMTASTPRR